MLEKITKKEIEFLESWYTPETLIQVLFSNVDNLTEFSNKFSELRLYQLPMVDSESLIDFEASIKYNNPNASKDEIRRLEMNMRKQVGDINNIGGRGYGKTLVTEKLDVPLSMLYDRGKTCAFGSPDGIHIRVLTDAIINAIENHPILKQFKVRTKSSHPILITAKNGWRLDGVNENVKSKSPGSHWFGLHVEKLWIEEISLENSKASEARKDALSEVGAVMRLSGMTNFTKNSPADKAFKDSKRLLNLPQFVKPTWCEEESEEKAKDYGGRKSLLWNVFVEGEVIPDSASEMDMDEVEKCYNLKKKIKRFELRKEEFKDFRRKIVVERPKNCDRIFIALDAGDGEGGTNIIIVSEKGNKYTYLYNIVLYKMKGDLQKEIIDYLIEKTQCNILAIDCGDGFGRSLANSLEKVYPKENIVRYSGNDKVIVGFETEIKNDKEAIIYKKGQPVVKEEFHSEWSVRRLKRLLYDQRIEIPKDDMFDNQLSAVVSTVSGTRTLYACPAETGDHLWSAWKVFAIAQWLKKDFNQTPNMNSNWAIGATNVTQRSKRDNTRALCYKDYIYRGKRVEVTEQEYKNFVRKVLFEYTEELLINKEIEKATLCKSEIKRLDKIFNIKGE